MNISHMMMYGDIGYGVGESFQGKGIGSSGVKSFVEKIFAETPLAYAVNFFMPDEAAHKISTTRPKIFFLLCLASYYKGTETLSDKGRETQQP